MLITKLPNEKLLRRHIALLLVAMLALFHSCAKAPKQEASRGDGAEAATAAWVKVVDGLNFPEGPAWDGRGALYVSNCYGGWITRLTDGQADTFLLARESPLTFGKTNGMTYHQGSLFACDFEIGAILKFSPEGRTELYAEGFEGQAFKRPNDLAFDTGGNLYFTDPKTYSREVLDGRIFRLAAPDNRIELLAEGLGFPNGIAFSPDARNLYVCESAFERILRFRVETDGGISHKETFVELPGGDPDGIDCDREGNLYVAHFGGGAVYVIAPDGGILQKIPTPGQKPTNLEFGGRDGKTLFLTEVETGALYQRQVGVASVAGSAREM